MNVIIFGATGGTGLELTRQALGKGHDVTAFVRNPGKLDNLQHSRLTTVCGDVLELAAVRPALEGKEAVLVAIGAGSKRSKIREEGTKNIIEAMQQTGVKRLICQSSLGVGDSRTNLSFFTRHVVVGIFLRHAFDDHERQEAVVKQSRVDWILVRPPHLKNGPLTGRYLHGFPTSGAKIKGWISRADVADFMLKQLDDDKYLRQTPGVSY